MSVIQIRKAQPEDAEALSLLICENANAILKPHYSNEQWETFLKYYAVEALREKIAVQEMFCAEQNGLIVGTVSLDKDFVVGFYTRLQYLGQGIGKLLMKHLETYAASTGLQSLELAASPEGVSFYLKNGWQKVRDCTFEYCGVGFEETLMRKALTSIHT